MPRTSLLLLLLLLMLLLLVWLAWTGAAERALALASAAATEVCPWSLPFGTFCWWPSRGSVVVVFGAEEGQAGVGGGCRIVVAEQKETTPNSPCLASCRRGERGEQRLGSGAYIQRVSLH